MRDKITSRPKARDGLWYPCLVEGSLLCKEGFGPKGGQSPVKYRGNLYVRTSLPRNLLWGLGQTGPFRGWLKPRNGQLRPLSGWLRPPEGWLVARTF